MRNNNDNACSPTNASHTAYFKCAHTKSTSQGKLHTKLGCSIGKKRSKKVAILLLEGKCAIVYSVRALRTHLAAAVPASSSAAASTSAEAEAGLASLEACRTGWDQTRPNRASCRCCATTQIDRVERKVVRYCYTSTRLLFQKVYTSRTLDWIFG